MPTPQEVETALLEMGGTCDEVVDFLRAREIKGWRGDPYSCPVACYLEQRFRVKLAVRRNRVCSVGGVMAIAPLPEAVKEMITEFDKGGYPELDSNLTV